MLFYFILSCLVLSCVGVFFLVLGNIWNKFSLPVSINYLVFSLCFLLRVRTAPFIVFGSWILCFVFLCKFFSATHNSNVFLIIIIVIIIIYVHPLLRVSIFYNISENLENLFAKKVKCHSLMRETFINSSWISLLWYSL